MRLDNLKVGVVGALKYINYKMNVVIHVILEICSVQLASELAQISADRLSFFLQHLISKHSNILVKSLPEHIKKWFMSVYKCIPI